MAAFVSELELLKGQVIQKMLAAEFFLNNYRFTLLLIQYNECRDIIHAWQSTCKMHDVVLHRVTSRGFRMVPPSLGGGKQKDLPGTLWWVERSTTKEKAVKNRTFKEHRCYLPSSPFPTSKKTTTFHITPHCIFARGHLGLCPETNPTIEYYMFT